MRLTVDAGHNCNPDGGAVGILNENILTKETVALLKVKFESLGHQIFDVTPYGMHFNSVTESLQYRVNKANSIGSDLHLCVHYNCFNSQAYGSECLISGTGGKSEVYARNILNAICETLGTTSRGVKVQNLYVPKYTNMPCVLIEGLFIDNQVDCNKYNASKIADAIVKGVTGQEVNQPTPTTNAKHPIMGVSDLTTQQMAQFLLQNNPTPSINCTALELAQIFLEEGTKEGVRGDVAFAQSLKETGYFKFGGDVKPEQNNYCGLGTIGGNVKGASFESPRIGVRAMVQHLKAYASTESLKGECVDPRYNLITTKGIAPNWEDLNGRWAVPGDNYGQEILSIYTKIKSVKVDSTPTQPTPNKKGYSYAVNGNVINDFFYTRNLDGTPNGGRIDIGDEICIIDCSFSKQMLLVEYPTPEGIKTAYIKYVPYCLQLYYENQYHNGGTSETVYFDSSMSSKWGSLDPREQATPLFRKDGHLCVLYRSGDKIKNGFVFYDGNFNKF